MTRGLNQRIETKESFVGDEIRFVLGARSRTAGKHPKVIRERDGFAGIEQVFDRNRSIDACEASVGPPEVQGRCPVTRLVFNNRSGSAFAGAKILRGGMGTKVTAANNCGGRSDRTSIQDVSGNTRCQPV